MLMGFNLGLMSPPQVQLLIEHMQCIVDKTYNENANHSELYRNKSLIFTL